MPTRRMTAEEKAEAAKAKAEEKRAELEAEGTYVSPLREEGPPVFEGEPEGNAVSRDFQEFIEKYKDDFKGESLAAWRQVHYKSLHAKLAEVYKHVGRLVKTGQAPSSMGGFKFVEAANVAESVRELLSDRNITFMPTGIEMIGSYERQTRSGNTMQIETYRVTWTFVDGDTGERHEVVSIGSGADSTDKAAPKAQTNAMKYALLMAFLIPTGDDPERVDAYEDGNGDIVIKESKIPNIKPGGRQGEITQAQFDQIRARAKELQLDPIGMKQVVEHALGRSVEPWPAGGTTDEQRDAILALIAALNFSEAGDVIRELHDEEEGD